MVELFCFAAAPCFLLYYNPMHTCFLDVNRVLYSYCLRLEANVYLIPVHIYAME